MHPASDGKTRSRETAGGGRGRVRTSSSIPNLISAAVSAVYVINAKRTAEYRQLHLFSPALRLSPAQYMARLFGQAVKNPNGSNPPRSQRPGSRCWPTKPARGPEIRAMDVPPARHALSNHTCPTRSKAVHRCGDPGQPGAVVVNFDKQHPAPSPTWSSSLAIAHPPHSHCVGWEEPALTWG